MAVREKPKSFVSGDGEEFATEKEAKLHDELLQATSDHRKARERLGRAMAATVKTADGHPFELCRYKPYWKVVEGWNQEPELRRVDFGYTCEISLQGEGNDQVRVVMHPHSKNPVEFHISEVYSEEQNAKAALAGLIKRHIAAMKAKLKELTTGGES